jgi:hypothetical protein
MEIPERTDQGGIGSSSRDGRDSHRVPSLGTTGQTEAFIPDTPLSWFLERGSPGARSWGPQRSGGPDVPVADVPVAGRPSTGNLYILGPRLSR